MQISFRINKQLICTLAVFFVLVATPEGTRLLQQNADYSAKTAFEDVQSLITMPSSENASEILLQYYQQGSLKEFIQGSGQLLEQGGVVGLIAVRRLAAGLQEANIQQPQIVNLFVTATAAAQDKYADAYIQVFEAMFRDAGCQIFGELSDAMVQYFVSSQSDQLGQCLQQQQQQEEEKEEVQQESAIIQVNETVAAFKLSLDAPKQEEGKQSDESLVPQFEPQQSQVNIQQLPPVSEAPQGDVDESMVSIITAVHHSNEAASNMIVSLLQQGQQASVVASLAQAVLNGHTEAGLEALGNSLEKGLECSEIQLILSLIAVQLSDISLDVLAQHARNIVDIQRCLGQGVDPCTQTQAASCCAISGPNSDCRLSYAEENSVPSVGLSVFRNSEGTKLCQCPPSS